MTTAYTKFLPKHLSLELSSFCNLSCYYCGSRLMKRARSHMTLETAKEVINQLPEFVANLEHITFNGYGESLLNPEAASIINLFKGLHKWLALSTNCTIYDDRIANCGLNQLILHVNSIEGLRYQNAYKYIANRNGLNSIIIQFVIAPDNQYIVEKFVEAFKHVTTDTHCQIFLKYPIQAKFLGIEFEALDNFYHLQKGSNVVVGGPVKQDRAEACGGLSDLVVVLSNGELMLGCCSPDPLWKIGSIEEGITKCINKPEVVELRNNFPNISPCIECKA